MSTEKVYSGNGSNAGFSKAARYLPIQFDAGFSFPLLSGDFEFINSLKSKDIPLPLVHLTGTAIDLDLCIMQYENDLCLACGENKQKTKINPNMIKRALQSEQTRLAVLNREQERRNGNRVGTAYFPPYKITYRDNGLGVVKRCLDQRGVIYEDEMFFSETTVQNKFKVLGYADYNIQFLVIKPKQVKEQNIDFDTQPIITSINGVPVAIIDKIDKTIIDRAMSIQHNTVVSKVKELKTNIAILDKCIANIKI